MFQTLDIASELFLEVRVNLVGNGGQVSAGLVKSAGMQLEAREMNVNSFAFQLVVRQAQGIGPGAQRLIGSRRSDAVVSHGDISGQGEIVRVEPHGVAVKRQRLVENLLLL